MARLLAALHLIICAPRAFSQPTVTSADFAGRALGALPVEESFDFIRQHTDGLPPRSRDPAATPLLGEMEVASTGWKLILASDASAPLVTGANELARYLKEAMGVAVAIERVGDLGDWASRRNAIVAARRDSRLGYEWEQDYIYTPDTIDEKIRVIDDTLVRQIPAYRRQQGF